MAQRQWNNRAFDDVSASDTGAETKVKHAAALVATERLHAGVVHDPHRATERGFVIKIDPALAEIKWFGNRVAVAHVARITDRDTLELPVRCGLFYLLYKKLGREFLAGGEFCLVAFAGLPDFDVGPTDVDHEYVHGCTSSGMVRM